MTRKLAIGVAAANTPAEFDFRRFKKALATQMHRANVYELKPAKAGGVVSAALDVWVVISRAADIAGLATFLWLVYEKFVSPYLPKDKKANSGLYVVVPFPGVGYEEFWLGKAYKDKDEFMREFAATAEKAWELYDQTLPAELVPPLDASEDWAKVKPDEQLPKQ